MSLSVSLQHTFDGAALDVQFDAPEGLTVLFGPSGSGKTTVIRAVAGLLKPDSAEIMVAGHRFNGADVFVPPERRGIGYIFQDHRLFPHMSVAQNLRFGQRFGGDGIEVPEGRVTEMLGLGPLMARRPAALSGGEAARVAIGRALLSRPRIILADEPLASLDAARKAEVLPYFERLRDELDVPILYVSHAAAEVARLATTVVALAQGRVQRAGPAFEVLSDPSVTPVGPRAAGAVIAAKVAAHHDDGLSALDAGGIALHLPRLAAPVGAAVRVRIAAQDVILSDRAPEGLSALNVLPCHVVSLRAGAGPGVIVALDSAAGRVLARVTRRSAEAMALAEGKPIWAVIKTVAVAPEDVGG